MFGGWLRNVPDEGMEATWPEVQRLARRSEEIGFDLTLIAELFLNGIKGVAAPALDAWSTAAALAAAAATVLLSQCSPQLEELERFAAQVMPWVGLPTVIAGESTRGAGAGAVVSMGPIKGADQGVRVLDGSIQQGVRALDGSMQQGL